MVGWNGTQGGESGTAIFDVKKPFFRFFLLATSKGHL